MSERGGGEVTDPITWPQPRRDGLHGEFYRYCAARELRFQRCLSCGRWRHMPREHCRHCHSGQWEWARSSGQGVVRSWTVCERAFHPGVERDLPYPVAVVEFEPGARLVARMVDTEIATLALDLPVEVCFEEIGPDCVVPRVRPRTGS